MKAFFIASIVLGSVLAPASAAVEKSGPKVMPAKPEAPPAKKEILIGAKGDGSIHVDGQKVTLEELPGTLKKLTGQDKASRIRIRGDAKVTYKRIVEVIEACQKAELWNISFSTERPEKENEAVK
ncbi:MAG: hypothetical protein EOP83_30710 [Verrucomicrobiaceae bacterium]|nr:MAG: hypothetical protein EOP83_30710 [Verrucomicrobiaceae bacterium]